MVSRAWACSRRSGSSLSSASSEAVTSTSSRRRHAEFYTALAERANGQLKRPRAPGVAGSSRD